MKDISENTKIRLSLVIVLGGGIAWLTSLKADTVALQNQYASIEKTQFQYLEIQSDIRDRLSRIEGMLKREFHKK